MKKIFLGLVVFLLGIVSLPESAFAAGIYPSGGGTKYVGDDVSIAISASGATFNAFSGTISVSGSVKVISCSPGDALWVTKPSGVGGFAGALTDSTGSFRIATLKVRGTGVGTGRVSISGVKLANKGAIVGSEGGSVSINFERRPTPPGAITVASETHPDQETAYEETTVKLSWDKPNGVTGFSYLLDDAAETTPESKASSLETSVSFSDQAIGTHYFHIKALNGDGWGPVTHFKINIKEPDPKVEENLSKPTISEIKKTDTFSENPLEGTVSGFIIVGSTLPNYMANIKFDPVPAIPDNKLLSALADDNGRFEFLVDFPIKAGFYKLTVQGQDNKTLTPLSDPLSFEISLAKGGAITILKADDATPPVVPPKKWYEKINLYLAFLGLAGIVALGIIGNISYFIIKHNKDKKLLAKSIRTKVKINE